MLRSWTVSGLGLALCLTCMGCGGTPPAAKGSDSEVKKLGIVFMRYLGAHRGQSPPNREELEKFIAAFSPDELKGMSITDPKEVFTSSRDDQELVVRYGITVPPPGPGDPTVVAYEKTGVGGKHLVVYGTAGVEEVTAERLHKLVPDSK